MKGIRQIVLPVGYEIKPESKVNRRSFAIKTSVLEEFKKIATEKGTNANALLNEILEEYVSKESE